MFFSDPEKITLSAVRRLIARVGGDHIDELINLRVCDRIGTGRPKEHPFRLRKYMSMIEEALRDPVTVQKLNIDGTALIALGEKPGPRIGWILHALLEEVFEDPHKNTHEELAERARSLQTLPDRELKALGEQGKGRKEAEERAEIQILRQKYKVS
jgi:poly(A) polymerase/tRNA nucleotidyltransferase (CCA-adding enzyme)